MAPSNQNRLNTHNKFSAKLTNILRKRTGETKSNPFSNSSNLVLLNELLVQGKVLVIAITIQSGFASKNSVMGTRLTESESVKVQHLIES